MLERGREFWIVVREGIVEHPHARGVALAQAKVLDGVHVSRLCPLQLVKVLVHDGNEPRCAGLARCEFWLANDDDRRKAERREGGLQVGRELARPSVNIVAHLLEILRRSREVRQVLRLGREQQKRSLYLAPARPDLVLYLRSQPVKLGNANHV